MFWSTHPAAALPKSGDIVTTTNSGQPLTVARRTRNKVGQVLLLTKDHAGAEQLLMVETVNWWPAVGDICTGIPVPFQRWLNEQLSAAIATGNDYKVKKAKYAFDDFNQLQSWFYGEFSIFHIEEDMATVEGARFSGKKTLPLSCVAVISRPSIAKILKEAEKDG